MDPDRWRQIERLYHEAQARPPGARAAFLGEACAGDAALRREVEALLESPATAEGFLTAPAVPLANLTGRRLGVYQVGEQIGAGGMGEVYRARDTRLGRDVAIKVLPGGLIADRDRLARFEREARMLAALNHPNIATIHGVEEADGMRALVMELVPGKTLAERVAGGPLRIGDALAIAGQIADALDAAHEKGIVHRDLKPANIKITPAGTVKVLDFGLAKATDAGHPNAPTLTAGGTGTGVIVGTAAYMSPEQARGLEVDKRTDIWAFGCVLYEMLTGRAAFARATITDTLAAVVSGDTDWNRLPVDTPAGVRKVLRRCLERDSRRRMRDIGEAQFELDEAVAPAPDAGALSPSGPRSRPNSWHAIALAALGGVLVLGVVMWDRLALPEAPSSAAAPSTALTVVSQLTNYGSAETAAAISPDGRSFAFVSNHAGSPDIWVRQVGGGDPVRLTNDGDLELDLAFAADGESIYFTRSISGRQSIWQTGALGGQLRKVLDDAHSPAPSPDGRELAYLKSQASLSETLWVSNVDGSGQRAVARDVPAFPLGRAAWSQDGRFLSYVRAGLFAPSNLFVIDMETGGERQVTRFQRPPEGIGRHVWLPDGRHLAVTYVAYSRALSVSDLAILDAQDGSLTRITASVGESFGMPTVSTDGSRLVATSTRPAFEIWKFPLRSSDPDANGRAGTRLIDQSEAPMWAFVSRDARTLLFNSPASGSRNLWTRTLGENSSPRQITALPGDAITHSSLSPDGTRVAFVAFTTGNSDIWVQNVDGSNLRQLTDDAAANAWPVWSPDGRQIVFTSASDGAQETRLVPADGGPSERLIEGFFRGDWVRNPFDNGTLIVTSDGDRSIRLIDPERRSVVWQAQFAGETGLPMFSADGRSISVPFAEAQDHSAVQVMDTLTGKGELRARLPFRVTFRTSWVDDGAAVIVNRFDQLSHVVLFDRFWASDSDERGRR